MDRMPITRAGYERLREGLKRLKTIDRREVANLIEVARSHGDLRENADYDSAKERQGMLEANIRDLEDKLARADIIDVSRHNGDRVVFGATVTFIDLDTDEVRSLTIVGELEADPTVGLISVASPLARGFIGKRVDDVALVQTPGGRKEYEITVIAFG